MASPSSRLHFLLLHLLSLVVLCSKSGQSMQSPVLPSYYSLLRRSLVLRLLVSLGEFFDRFSRFLELIDSVQWLLLTIFLHKQELVCLEDVYAIY